MKVSVIMVCVKHNKVSDNYAMELHWRDDVFCLLRVCICTMYGLVKAEARGQQIPWNHRWLRPTLWMLGLEHLKEQPVLLTSKPPLQPLHLLLY